jgi:hypothetical protein
MKVATGIVCLLIAGIAQGASPIVVDLGVAEPATPRTYAVDPGKFDIKLINAIPNKRYEIVGDKREETAVVEVVPPAAATQCEATPEQVARILTKILAEKKAKVTEDKQDDVKVTEADIAEELAGDLGCRVETNKANLDVSKTKVAADKTKIDADVARAIADLAALDADIKKLQADRTSATGEAVPKIDADIKKLQARKPLLDVQKKQFEIDRLKLVAKAALIDATLAELAEIAKLDKEIATLDQNIAKLRADKKPDEEIGKEEAKKAKQVADRAKRQTALESEKTILLSIRDLFSVSFKGYALTAGETLPKTFKGVGEETTWPIVITTQGGAAAVTAQAAAKAANPTASDNPVLDRLLATTADHPNLIVGTCKYTDLACSKPIYINADQISTLSITDIPPGAVTVRVTGGEYFKCEALRFNVAKYSAAPDTMMFPLHMKKGVLGVGGGRIAVAEAEAASLYGVDWCPHTEQVIQKRSMFRDEKEDLEYGEIVLARERLRNNKDFNTLAQVPDPRYITYKAPPIAALPLFLRGKSQVIEVQFDWQNGITKTFIVPVVYQRFWLDAGGFFVFARRTDQSLDLENLGGTPEKQRVRAIRSQTSIEPNTGIVINIHPGNFPALALQFGLAANQGRLPSYYLGLGVRAREIGKRGLATLGVGVAMQQEQQFPGALFLEDYESTSPVLKPTNKYGFTFPYVSLSLGFSFGGVSEKTNVADSVQP